MFATQVAEIVARDTNSEIVQLVLIFASVITMVGIPFYNIKTKSERARQTADLEAKRVEKEEQNRADQEKHQQYIEREAQLLDVISRNSAALASLTSVMEQHVASLTCIQGEQQLIRNEVNVALGYLYKRGGIPNE